MNKYKVGDLVRVTGFVNFGYMRPYVVRRVTGLLVEELDDGLIYVLVGDKKELFDIAESSASKFYKVEVLSRGKEEK